MMTTGWAGPNHSRTCPARRRAGAAFPARGKLNTAGLQTTPEAQLTSRSDSDAVGLAGIGVPPTQRGDHLGGEGLRGLPDHEAHQVPVVAVAIDQAPGVLLTAGVPCLQRDRSDVAKNS